MSGGHFDYDQYRLVDHADKILDVMKNNNKEEVYNYETHDYDYFEKEGWENHTPQTIKEFIAAYIKLKEAYIYLQRIDWYLSGDDSEESFHRRLKEDFDKLGSELSNTDFGIGVILI
jgi:hypothetical protein